MSKKLIVGILLILVVLVGAFVWLSPKTANKKSEPATTRLKIISTGVLLNGQPANSNSSLQAGDQITTDATGRAEIDFADGKTVTRIDKNSEIKIADLQNSTTQTKIDLVGGRIWSRVGKLLGQESYQTESSNLIASIRGTSYGQDVLAKGLDRIVTIKDTVQATCKNNSKITAEVSQNFKATFNCPVGRPVSVEPLAAQDYQDEWVLFNLGQDLTINISSVQIVCSPFTQPDCGDGHTKVRLTSSDFNNRLPIRVEAVDISGGIHTSNEAFPFESQTVVLAHFSDRLAGKYSIKVSQGPVTGELTDAFEIK